MQNILVTGAAGFIGSHFARLVLAKSDAKVIIVDALTYAGTRLNIEDCLKDAKRCVFVQADIADEEAMAKVFAEHAPDAVVNFAAESHVDRSIEGPGIFLKTNTWGVFNLLECSRAHIKQLSPEQRAAFRFLQVSTDEVYGSLGSSGAFREDTPYAPNSPYSASKAAADHLVRAYTHTYGMNTVITNCSNNYGPNQFPEKLIPLMILNGLEAKDLPVYGDGANIRDWLYVTDHCEGIWLALQNGRSGEKYNIGGHGERSNIEVVKLLCAELEELAPAANNQRLKARGLKSYDDLITYVPDRPGHDRRYAIDSSKIAAELGWKPQQSFESGLALTAKWYFENQEWCRKVQEGKYQRERLGTLKEGRA